MKTRDLVDLFVLGAIWGASFLFMRVAVPEFGAVPLIAARVGIAAIFLIPVLAQRGRLRHLYEHAPQLTLLGAINSAIPFSLFAFAVLSVTAGFAAVLNSTAPLFGALVAFVWLRDRPGPARIAGLIVGFAGVLVLVWGRVSVADDGGGLAVIAGLTAAVLYGISANYVKKRLSGVDSLVVATGSLIAATVLLVPLAVLYWPEAPPSATSWISAILLAVICTGVAYILLLPPVEPHRSLEVAGRHLSDSRIWRGVGLSPPTRADYGEHGRGVRRHSARHDPSHGHAVELALTAGTTFSGGAYSDQRGITMTIRRLTRSRTNGTIAGVCAGLANYYGVDVVLVRLLFVILSIAGAIIGGVIVYVAAWVIMPEGDDQPMPATDKRVLRRSTTDRQIAGVWAALRNTFR